MSASRQRILLIDDAALWGGAEVVLGRYVAFLEGWHRVVVRSVDAPEPEERWGGERQYRIPFPHFPPGLSNPWVALRAMPGALRCAWRLVRMARRERVAVLLVNTLWALVPVVLANLLLRLPLVYVVHHTDVPMNRASQWLFGRCTQVVGCSRFVADMFGCVPAERRRVLYNSVEAEEVVGVDIREALGWQGRWVIGYVGRLDDGKNVDGLLRGLAEARADLPEAAGLVVIGEGPAREALEALAGGLGLGDCVHFAGYLEAPWSVAGGLDGLCLASHGEALPLTILEAQARGVPVLASPVGGIPELIEDGVTGLLTEGTSPAAIAAGLRRLREHRGDATMTTAAREQALTHFSPERQREGLLAILDEAMGAS